MPTKKTEKLTTREVAEAIGTDPRTLRVFLRASEHYTNAGSGARYSFTSDDLGPMKTRFTAWRKERDEEKARREAEAEQATPAEDDAPAEEKPAPKRTTRTRKTA